MNPQFQSTMEDRFIGCLLGVAIGDALGMPIEGWSREAIRMHHGRIQRVAAHANQVALAGGEPRTH